MNTRRYAFSLFGALALVACAPGPTEPPDRGAEAEDAVRATIRAWAEAAEVKDVETFLSFYTEDIVVLTEGEPDLRGITAVREAVTQMMSDPLFELSFGPEDVRASRSGDLAYETGWYSLTMSGPDGDAVAIDGAYVAVWENQADGTWKCALDAPVSGPPREATSEPTPARP